jgi:hypothetical protein
VFYGAGARRALGDRPFACRRTRLDILRQAAQIGVSRGLVDPAESSGDRQGLGLAFLALLPDEAPVLAARERELDRVAGGRARVCP